MGNGSGKLEFPDFAPVPQGDSIIYFSDAQGSPATFKVVYRLSPYAAMQPGDYQAAMVYSLNEI